MVTFRSLIEFPFKHFLIEACDHVITCINKLALLVNDCVQRTWTEFGLLAIMSPNRFAS